MPGVSLKDGDCNTLCIRKDILHQKTPGLITKTSTPPNYSSNITIPPRLDEWTYKNTPAYHQKIPIFYTTYNV